MFSKVHLKIQKIISKSHFLEFLVFGYQQKIKSMKNTHFGQREKYSVW